MSVLNSLINNGDLKRKFLYTVFFLSIYRLGVFVSTPGINTAKLKELFESQAGSLLGIVNMFSGGALENFSILALGIAPYISVSIIIQMLTPVVPQLDQLKKDGAAGQRKLTKYTRIFTILLAFIQGFLIASGLESQQLTVTTGLSFKLLTAITLCSGTAFMMWLGEQITEKGIGNGVSLLIFSGIIARMPSTLVSTLVLARQGEISPLIILVALAFCVVTIFGIVFIETSVRKVSIHYPKRVVGQRVANAQMQHMPLKINIAGVIPPIFASALLAIPSYLIGFSGVPELAQYSSYLLPGNYVYESIFAILIVWFSFFYTSVVFNPEEVAENLKKSGGFIPSVRPGAETVDYLYSLLTKLTFWGSLYLATLCILPQIIYIKLGLVDFSYIFGGTAILIVVGVTIDTINQVNSLLLQQKYDDLEQQMKAREGAFKKRDRSFKFVR
jgi:preprotein translocase subunit SecY